MKLSRGSTSEQVHGMGLSLPRPPKSAANDVAARMASNTAQAAAGAMYSQSVRLQLLPAAHQERDWLHEAAVFISSASCSNYCM
jgi:hypothetical protein